QLACLEVLGAAAGRKQPIPEIAEPVWSNLRLANGKPSFGRGAVPDWRGRLRRLDAVTDKGPARKTRNRRGPVRDILPALGADEARLRRDGGRCRLTRDDDRQPAVQWIGDGCGRRLGCKGGSCDRNRWGRPLIGQPPTHQASDAAPR